MANLHVLDPRSPSSLKDFGLPFTVVSAILSALVSGRKYMYGIRLCGTRVHLCMHGASDHLFMHGASDCHR